MPVASAAPGGVAASGDCPASDGFADLLGLCLPSIQPQPAAGGQPVPASASETVAVAASRATSPGVSIAVPETPAPVACASARAWQVASVPETPSAVSDAVEADTESSSPVPPTAEATVSVEHLAEAVVFAQPLPSVPVDMTLVSSVHRCDGVRLSEGEGERRRGAFPASAVSTAETPDASMPNTGTAPEMIRGSDTSSKAVANALQDVPSAAVLPAAAVPAATPAPRSEPAAAASPDIAEKIAAQVPAPAQTATATESKPRENNFLNVDGKREKDASRGLGIVNAKPAASMRPSPAHFTMRSSAGMPGEGVEMNPAATVPAVSTAATSENPAAREEPSLKISGRALDVAGAVGEIVEHAHAFRARERGSVEVTFDFKDDTRLAVRVSMRDGGVHADFRTDSDELRAVLGREWRSAAEGRGLSVVEPSFSPSRDAQPSSSRDASAGFSSDADARRQDPRQSGESPSRAAASPHAPASPAVSRAPVPARVSHPDRLLHAFA